MNREDMIEAVVRAMDNVADIDTPWSKYAAVAVDALGWQDFNKTSPQTGGFVICTNGRARWVDKYSWAGRVPEFDGAKATHWHPVQEIPSGIDASR